MINHLMQQPETEFISEVGKLLLIVMFCCVSSMVNEQSIHVTLRIFKGHDKVSSLHQLTF